MAMVNLAVEDDVRVRTMQVERFYYDEAALLEQSDYTSWLELVAEDVVYTMPQREFADRRTNHALDAVGAHSLSDDKGSLARRAKWLLGPPTPEAPPPFRRYLITNVRVMGESDAGIEAHSKFLLWEFTSQGKRATFIGAREDLLRQTEDGLLIARRLVLVDSPVLPKALTTFL